VRVPESVEEEEEIRCTSYLSALSITFEEHG